MSKGICTITTRCIGQVSGISGGRLPGGLTCGNSAKEICRKALRAIFISAAVMFSSTVRVRSGCITLEQVLQIDPRWSLSSISLEEAKDGCDQETDVNNKDKLLIILILCGGALFLVLQKHSKEYYASFEQPQSPAVGKPASRYRAPDFTLADLEGNDFKLTDSRGNVVAVMFWTTW